MFVSRNTDFATKHVPVSVYLCNTAAAPANLSNDTVAVIKRALLKWFSINVEQMNISLVFLCSYFKSLLEKIYSIERLLLFCFSEILKFFLGFETSAYLFDEKVLCYATTNPPEMFDSTKETFSF